MIGNWVVSAIVRFSTTGVNSLRGAGAEINRLGVMADGHTSKIQRMTAALDAYHTKMLQVGQATSGALALGGAAVSVYGIYGAAQMQRALTGVGIALNSSSPRAMQQYAQLAFKTSGITAQDVNTIAGEMAMAATSGLNDRGKLTEAFTRIAKAADVLWMSPKHIDPIESVRQMSMLSHLFGVYSGAPLQHMLDRASQMMFVQPEALQSGVTQGRMFIPTARAAGVSEEDIFRQMMTMGQTGYLRSRGGSGVARMIEYLSGAATMTGHLSKLQHSAMFDLGLTTSAGPKGTLRQEFLGPNGALLLGKVVEHLEAIRSKFSDTGFVGELQRAFLAQGGRYAAAILTPSVYAKSQQNWTRMNEIGGVDQMFAKYSKNFIYQWSVFWTNLVNIPKAIFLPLLPQLTDMFHNFGKDLSGIVSFLAEHPNVAKKWGEGIIAFTIAMGAAWVGFGLVLARQAIMMPFAMARLSASIDAFTAKVGVDATAINTASGTASAGLRGLALAIGGISGAVVAIASAAGILYGAEQNAQWAKKHQKLAHWFQSGGGNRGETPPGTEGTVDIFGRPLPGSGITLPSARKSSGSTHQSRKSGNRVSMAPITHVAISNMTVVTPNAKSFGDDLRSKLYNSGGYSTASVLPMAMTVGPRA